MPACFRIATVHVAATVQGRRCRLASRQEWSRPLGHLRLLPWPYGLGWSSLCGRKLGITLSVALSACDAGSFVSAGRRDARVRALCRLATVGASFRGVTHGASGDRRRASVGNSSLLTRASIQR